MARLAKKYICRSICSGDPWNAKTRMATVAALAMEVTMRVVAPVRSCAHSKVAGASRTRVARIIIQSGPSSRTRLRIKIKEKLIQSSPTMP